jgi:hypothetical protein
MEANTSWQGDGNAAQGGSKMIPNEVLAAWIVAAITGAAALGGLSLLDSRSTSSGMEAEPLPFYSASMSTGQRLPPSDEAWRARLEATGSLPVRPAAILADWGDDDVDEMEQEHGRDNLLAGSLATIDVLAEVVEP